nr:minor coat protein [Sweet potato chlorotic stunt virus]QYA73615.1 minor coat protein [Sweet potato chlorotic stunt virus]QYA73626.1 minor coat protein [Sweet potato chlorotic stunt virus]QYA73637.1 minor coat protein [Sweet potato chlorotic stunt virus]QYA73648.1 minor coat protein [Sweet potato chlorotic stunt virus]
MEELDDSVSNTIVDNYSDDEQSVVARASGCELNQDYLLPYKDKEQVDLSISYSSALRTKPVSVKLYFHIGKGFVVYSCKPVENFNQKVYESNLGAFFSSFTNLVTPRKPRGTNAFRFGYLRAGNDCFILVEGWRIVQIPNAEKIVGVTLRLTLDIDEVQFSKSGKLVGNIIDLPSCLNSTRPSDLFSNLKPSSVTLFSLSTKDSVNVQPSKTIPLSKIESAVDLDLKPFRNDGETNPDKNLTEIDTLKKTMGVEEDKEKIFRIYYSNFLDSGFNGSLSYQIMWPNISCDGMSVNHQFWLGDRDDMLEGGVQYIHTEPAHRLFFVHRRGDVSEYYKTDEASVNKVLNSLPTELRFVITRGSDGKFVVSVNEIVFLTTVLPKVGSKVQIGWEIKIFKGKFKGFNRERLSTFETVPRESQVKSNGELVNLRKYDFEMTESDACGWNLKRKSGLRLRNIRNVTEMLAQDDVKEPPVDNNNMKPDRESIPEKKVELEELNERVDNQKEKFEEFALKAIVYQPISKIDDERIFNSIIKHYVSKGLSSWQAELVVYQMGVSFCTSVNSCANSNLNLIVTKSDGSFLRVSKADHVMRLQLLCNKYCNVERTLLRNRSDKIFRLLKAGILTPPFRHARNRGLKSDMAHMACDFMDYSTIPLSDEENLALTSIQRYVLMKNKHRRSIVNVNQLY